jgi:predicted nucleic acid-binding protein
VILVDSSVWVDYLRGTPTPQADRLDALLGTVPLAVGDLILTEVLQGCATDREFNEVRRLLLNLTVVALGGREVAIEAARNHRRLRALGLTVRKTIDTVIATRCIVDKLELLHSDRNFDPFEQHLGLRCVPCGA